METPDYKSTVFLPQTDFPMKGNLPQKEPEIIQMWNEKSIYKKMTAKNAQGPNFTMPDGPPYANGQIHIGHALNKNLKDIVIKYKNMQGFQACFIPGWDCHGLPIEHKVMKELTDKKQTATDAEILKLCRQEATKWIKAQQDQFIRLGVLADWEHPYYTMMADYEAEEIREFARAFEKGLIYRGEKPVYWNFLLKTALADAEVEYHPHKSPSIYVRFPVKDTKALQKLGSPAGQTSFVIWTTTPWTLPSNVAICLNADFEYGIFKSENEFFVIAKELQESFEKEVQKSLTLVSTFKGADLEFLEAQHPFYPRPSPIILGDHVSLEAGTGCVHTAPGHGADDYKVGHLKYNLPVLSPVDESGCFTNEVPEYFGIHIFKANPMIVERLRTDGKLLQLKEIEHSYPHCWRSKVPLFFRATPQWFIGLDMESKNPTLRSQVLKAVSETAFFPSWGEARLKSMMENRPDWCLSRQRIWGVPIPIFYCQATGTPVADVKAMYKAADVIEKEGGIEAYYQHPAEFYLGNFEHPKDAPPEFGSKGFRLGKDILDVWFDSGICHAAIQKKRPGMKFPADLYLEGSDQHRGWFNTSMLSSMTTNGKSPFKALITHGFVNDSQGRKMSKSLGNVIDPQEIAKVSGAEILRLWSIYEDYGQDLRCGKEELTRVTETYRGIRNRFKYFLGVLSDFNFEKDQVPYAQMTVVDRWVLNELAILIDEVTQAYDRYEFFKIYHLLNVFFTVTLSSTYLDIMKDRLYTWKQNGLPRRSTQTAVHLICDSLMRLMAPVLSFLAEEVYSYIPNRKEESVFLLGFPKSKPEWKNESLGKDFETILKVRSDVQKQLEGLRNQQVIKANLEAHLDLQCEGETFEILKRYEKDLRELFIVSTLNLSQDTYQIQTRKADGEKCPRCWVWSTNISRDSKHLGVCPKCVEALT